MNAAHVADLQRARDLLFGDETDPAGAAEILRSTHRAAAEFTGQLAPKYPDAASHLETAAKCFAAEADALDRCGQHLGWQTPEGPDPQRNAHASKLLAEARDGYAAGIDAIERALEIIG